MADADEIIVLDDGLVRERGSHTQLYAAGGLYRELWDLQQAESHARAHTPGLRDRTVLRA